MRQDYAVRGPRGKTVSSPGSVASRQDSSGSGVHRDAPALKFALHETLAPQSAGKPSHI
jgi:hypothetical protein